MPLDQFTIPKGFTGFTDVVVTRCSTHTSQHFMIVDRGTLVIEKRENPTTTFLLRCFDQEMGVIVPLSTIRRISYEHRISANYTHEKGAVTLGLENEGEMITLEFKMDRDKSKELYKQLKKTLKTPCNVNA